MEVTFIGLIAVVALGFSIYAALAAYNAEQGEARVHKRMNGFFQALGMSGREVGRRFSYLESRLDGYHKRLTGQAVRLVNLEIEARKRPKHGNHSETSDHRSQPSVIDMARTPSPSSPETHGSNLRPGDGLDEGRRDLGREGSYYEPTPEEVSWDRSRRGQEGTLPRELEWGC